MQRRWIIRGFFIGLVVLCAGGWVASYVHSFSMAKGYSTFWRIELTNGRMYTLYEGHSPFIEIDAPYDWRIDKQLLGFNVQTDHTLKGLDLTMDVPLWCPTVLSGLTLLLVWRKTRKRTSGGAFPVVHGLNTGSAR